MKRRLIFSSLLLSLSVLVLLGLFFYRQKSSQVNQSVENVSPTPQLQIEEKIIVIHGIASLERNGGKKELTQGTSAILQAGDSITLNLEGLAVIDYQQGTVVRLGPGTQLIFQGRANSVDSLKQIMGSVYVRFRKILGLRDGFDLTTPTAVATVRGTKFASFVKSSKLTKLVVTESAVGVAQVMESGEKPTASSEKVGSGHQALVAAGESISVELTQLAEEELSWLWFNEQADAVSDDPDSVATISSQLFVTPTSTPKPIATVAPTATPAPTKPPVLPITSMPGEGYSRNLVKTDAGDFTLTCVGASKNSVQVMTDSANETECLDNCPVLPLQEYATRNGGFAAMNGMYFCPSDYPQCAGKVNTYDTLFFNSRVHRYINSDQNGASVVPFLGINSSGNPVFERESRNWPRDTGIQAGTAGNPLLILGTGNVVDQYNLDDKQRNVKSNRGAFVEEGDKIYLCVTSGANVPDSAKVYQALGADNAINIDGGGSSALWYNGSYIYGPGRNLPTSIVLVRK